MYVCMYVYCTTNINNNNNKEKKTATNVRENLN